MDIICLRNFSVFLQRMIVIATREKRVKNRENARKREIVNIILNFVKKVVDKPSALW